LRTISASRPGPDAQRHRIPERDIDHVRKTQARHYRYPRYGALVLFDAEGRVVGRRVLASAGETLGADLPPETWHTVVALDPGSVFFEAKAGPYVPAAGADVAGWAPAEGSPEAAAFERKWRALFTEE
jgi:hypothetical protein